METRLNYMKEICSICRTDKICKNTPTGRMIITDGDKVSFTHIQIEECPIYKENTKYHKTKEEMDLLMKGDNGKKL